MHRRRDARDDAQTCADAAERREADTAGRPDTEAGTRGTETHGSETHGSETHGGEPHGSARPEAGTEARKDAPLRSDAQRNRERILEVALAELTHSADAPLSAIAKKAGVGQGTFYRNFPNREALVLEVYRYEVQQVADTAAQLLATRAPDRALREWMDRLAQYAMAKAGLADAMRRATCSRGSLAGLGHAPLTSAITLLLTANEEAGTIRPGVTPDDFLLAIAGLWQIDPHGDWQTRAARLLDLVMDGLRAGARRG